jgi:integrating conjugative element protein (TIGR03759 family)
MKKLIILFLLMNIFSDIALAENNIENTQDNSTQIQNTLLNNAKEWNLTPDEYLKYQNLMKGKAGLWYQQLTPASVLGLNADNIQDQKHFAEVVAREEHDRLANELKFDLAIHQALLRLYPDERIIKSFDMTAYNPVFKKQET